MTHCMISWITEATQHDSYIAVRFLYPNKSGTDRSSAMEVLGQSGINAVLNHSKQSHLIHHYPECAGPRVRIHLHQANLC